MGKGQGQGAGSRDSERHKGKYEKDEINPSLFYDTKAPHFNDLLAHSL